MSSEILRKSLQLFDDELSESKGTKKRKKGQDLPAVKSTLKKGVKKQEKKAMSQKSQSRKSQRKIGSAVENYRRKKPTNNTEDNLYYLTRISEKAKMNNSVAKTIIDHSKGNLSKHNPVAKKSKDSTVFTDRDFEKFEEEYDFFS